MTPVFDASWQRPHAPMAVAFPRPMTGQLMTGATVLDLENETHRAAWHAYTASQLQPGDGLILYVSRTTSKMPTTAELQNYRDKGVIVRRVFEDSATRAATGTYADGLAD